MSPVPLAYPKPTSEILGPPNLPKYAYPGLPVDLSSVYPPPEALQKPSLPSGQRKPIWGDDDRIPYTLTTHIVPTAYFREDEDIVLPDTPTADETMTKDERKICIRKAELKLREIRRKYENEGRHPQHKALWLCLNRYARTSTHTAKGGLTLFFAHANGFHKEVMIFPVRHAKSTNPPHRPGNRQSNHYCRHNSLNHGFKRYGYGKHVIMAILRCSTSGSSIA